MRGKSRIAASLAGRILGRNPFIVEPFCGALAMTALLQPALASDISRPVMTLIRAVRDGWTPPPFLSEEVYNDCRARKEEVDDPLVAFAGHCTFGGKWFGGYARPHSSQPDPTGASARSLLRRVNACSKTTFKTCTYQEQFIPRGALVYCDPPYAGTTSGYWCKDAFDHETFWSWARALSCDHDVIVSEYAAPEDFVSVFDLNRPTFMRTNVDADRRIEKLFIHESRATHETDSNIRSVDRVLCSESRGAGRPPLG